MIFYFFVLLFWPLFWGGGGFLSKSSFKKLQSRGMDEGSFSLRIESTKPFFLKCESTREASKSLEVLCFPVSKRVIGTYPDGQLRKMVVTKELRKEIALR